MLNEKITLIPGHTMRSVVPLGTTRMTVPGRRSKEPDLTLRPATRARANNRWPSVVIEVGYSEKLPQLRLNAQWWLINLASQTRCVIVIHVARNPNRLHLECWSMAPPQRITRHTPPLVPRCEQEFGIDSAGPITTTHAQLTIPYTSVFDLPHPAGADIIFTLAELSSFATWVFSQWI